MGKRIGNIEVIESKRWRNTKTNQTASIYGALPYYGDQGDWIIERIGWTLRDIKSGMVGMARPPFETKREATQRAREIMNKRREYERIMERLTNNAELD